MQELLILFGFLEGFLSTEEYGVFVVGVFLAVAWLGVPWICLGVGNRANRLRRLIGALPTSKVRGVFIGLVELKGTVESREPLVSFIAEKPCVWYSYTVEEHWRRVDVETVVVNGKTQTRTVVRSGWTTVASGGCQKAFSLRDDSGEIVVHPAGADVEPLEVASFHCSPSHDAYYAKGPEDAIANSTHERRFEETAIPVGAEIYLVGPSRECRDRVAAEIAEGEDGEEFIISTRREESIRLSKGIKAWCFALLGMLLLAGIAYVEREIFFDRTSDAEIVKTVRASFPLWGIMAIVYVGVWWVSWTWTVYNSLVDIRNRVRQGWAQMEVQLQRRHELIPELCKVAEEYALHEKTVMEHVARLRTMGDSEGVGFRALGEAYPDLKASPVFDRLMQELSDTEARIALAREYYNTIATHLNTRLSVFPEGIVGRLFGVNQVGLYEGFSGLKNASA